MVKGAVRPGWKSLENLPSGNRRGTQSRRWLRRQPPARGNPRCNGERLVCSCNPTGAWRTAPPPLVFSSYAAGVGKQPELNARSGRSLKRARSVYALRR